MASPPRRGRPPGPSDKVKAQLAAYDELGPMPSDPLEANTWLMRALQASAREVLTDTSLKPKQRRAELRAIARACVPLTPAGRLLAAEQIVRGALEARERRRLDPVLTPAPPGLEPLQMQPGEPPARPAPASASPPPLQMPPAPPRPEE